MSKTYYNTIPSTQSTSQEFPMKQDLIEPKSIQINPSISVKAMNVRGIPLKSLVSQSKAFTFCLLPCWQSL